MWDVRLAKVERGESRRRRVKVKEAKGREEEGENEKWGRGKTIHVESTMKQRIERVSFCQKTFPVPLLPTPSYPSLPPPPPYDRILLRRMIHGAPL